MIINNNYFPIIDEEYKNYIEANPDMNDRWLLEQTLYTGAGRRELLPNLPIPVMGKALDLGAGFGAMAIDMAFAMPVQVYATDSDKEKVEVAQAISDQVTRRVNYLKPGEIAFQQADIYDLPFSDNTFDFVISRFLFQHIADPEKAFAQIQRVLKPGGIVCTIDVDESFAFSYPETPAYEALYGAFKQLQEKNGGDRQIGRKLSYLLEKGGYVEIVSSVQMQSAYAYTAAGDLAHRFIRERFMSAKNDIVVNGIMTNEEFTSWMDKYNDEVNLWQFTASGQVISFARKKN